jgi:hypothetical protein
VVPEHRLLQRQAVGVLGRQQDLRAGPPRVPLQGHRQPHPRQRPHRHRQDDEGPPGLGGGAKRRLRRGAGGGASQGARVRALLARARHDAQAPCRTALVTGLWRRLPEDVVGLDSRRVEEGACGSRWEIGQGPVRRPALPRPSPRAAQWSSRRDAARLRPAGQAPDRRDGRPAGGGALAVQHLPRPPLRGGRARDLGLADRRERVQRRVRP